MTGIERRQPALLNFALRVLASDGQLYEIDGNKDFSIGVYLAEIREGKYARTSELLMPVNIPTDEMRAAGNVMEEYADRILKSVNRSHDQNVPSRPAEQIASPEELTTLQRKVANIEMVFSHQGGFSDAEIAGIVQRFIENYEEPPTKRHDEDAPSGGR